MMIQRQPLPTREILQKERDRLHRLMRRFDLMPRHCERAAKGLGVDADAYAFRALKNRPPNLALSRVGDLKPAVELAARGAGWNGK